MMTAPALFLENKMKLTQNAGFAAAFGGTPNHYFSAPGRTEIGGNHTDHQRGRILAGAVNLDTVAAVKRNGTKHCGLAESVDKNPESKAACQHFADRMNQEV